jgi:hypothetical protein
LLTACNEDDGAIVDDAVGDRRFKAAVERELEPSTGRAADARWTVESASALASMTTASPRLSSAWSTAPSSPGWRVTSSKPIASSQSIAAGASR